MLYGKMVSKGARGSLVVLSGLLLLAGTAVGQQEPAGTEVMLGVGFARGVSYDLSASPLRYAGVSVPLDLGVRWRGTRRSMDVRIQAASTEVNARPMTNAAGNELPGWDQLNLGFTAAWRLADAHWLGGRLRSDVRTRTYDYLDGVSWDLTASLDAIYRYERAIPYVWMQAEAGATLGGYVNRPPYFLASAELFGVLYDGEGSFLGLGGFESPRDVQQGTVSVRLRRSVTRRLAAEAVLDGQWTRLTRPEETVFFHQGLSFRLLLAL
ncbi:MAG: hypothetical protein AAGI08_12335 [Bacteroidota bacterium]